MGRRPAKALTSMSAGEAVGRGGGDVMMMMMMMMMLEGHALSDDLGEGWTCVAWAGGQPRHEFL